MESRVSFNDFIPMLSQLTVTVVGLVLRFVNELILFVGYVVKYESMMTRKKYG
jgi:hypothetical protein